MIQPRPTRATNENGTVLIQTSARLMDDYIYSSDVDVATDLMTIQEADGSYSLLYIGATANLMLLSEDPASDTGWTETALDNSFLASQVTATIDASGNLVVFAVGPNVAQPDIYTTTRSATGWSQWLSIVPDGNVPESVQVVNLAALVLNGTVGLWVIIGPSPDQQGNSALWQVIWNEVVPIWNQIADIDQPIMEFCTLADFGTCLLVSNTAASNPVALDLFVLPLSPGGALQPLAQSVSLTTLAVGLNADGNSALYIADNGVSSGICQIQYLDGSNPQGGFITVDTNTAAATLLVANAGTTPLTLFAVDGENLLHHIAAPTSSEQGDDFNFSLNFSVATTATNTQGSAELIGFIPGKGLLRLCASPADDEGRIAWSQEALRYQPINQRLRQTSTYAVTLAFRDMSGVPLAGHLVELRASTVSAAQIAGLDLQLGPAHPVSVYADARGLVRVTLPTNSLRSPVLSANIPALMMIGEDFVISPDVHIKNRFAVVTVDDVTAFINPEFATNPTIVGHVQQAIRATMDNISDKPLPTVQFRKTRRADLKTPLLGGCGGSHSFRVENGHTTFSLLSDHEARMRIAAIAASEFGFFDWFEDAVDAIANAVTDAATWTYDHVITPVANGIHVAITFISDTVQVAWTGLIDTVEDAFRFVESVLDAVKTFFERLYNFFAWLLSNARKDIWATKQYFENLLNQGYLDLAKYAREGAPLVGGFFTSLETNVDQLFAQIEGSLGLINSNQAINASPSGLADGITDSYIEIIEDVAASSTWLLDKISGVLGLDPNISLPESVMRDGVALITLISSTFGQEIQVLATNFLQRLQSLATSTANLGNALLKTLLDEAKDILLAILKLLDSVVAAVLNFLGANFQLIASSIFGATIGNAFVQSLYDLINPGQSESLTVQGLGCLLLGFVTTVAYKAIFDNVPFPHDVQSASVIASSNGIPFILAGLVQTTIWTFYDLEIDIAPQADFKWQYFSMALLAPLAIQLCTKPLGDPVFDTPQNVAKWGSWFTGFSTSAYKIIWGIGMVAKVFPKGPRGTLPGSLGLAACGLGTLGTNIWSGAVNGFDAVGWISAVASPLSPLVKPAQHLIVDPVTKKAVLVVTDITSNIGGGAAKIMKGVSM